ncbi:MAG: Na+/H+ antiporter NhaC [Acidobacteria bacterium]|nr:Na+/H+ antiporter NhaC [Acidobacteriota bacterium]
MDPTPNRTPADRPQRTPTLWESLLPLVAIALLMGVGYGIYQLPGEVLLIAASAVAGVIAWRLGYSYREIETGIIESMMKAMPAMLIVIIVGALIGSWIAAGTIPWLIYYGLQLIAPHYFLLTACVVCSIVSLVTGTSWGTVGTVGVAFMGIAHGLQIPLEQAAGAIVAGAYFGDKISPFSDTTNLAPVAAKSNLFDHIRHLLWTTLPAWVLGLVVYLILGLAIPRSSTASLEQMGLILTTIENHFHFHWLVFLPLVITLYAAVRKRPVIPFMLLSVLVAVLLALFVQGAALQPAVASVLSGHSATTGQPMVDRLLNRGGMLEMMDITLLALCAFAFGGIIRRAGMLDVLLDRLLRVARTTGALITATVFSCFTVALLTGSSFLSILIPGELFAPAYRTRNLAAKNLSRTTEDSGTVVMPLIPWSIAGVFMAGTLGVPTLAYAKWAIMCYTGFLFALLYGFTGIGIAPRIRDDETIAGS